MSLPQPSAGMSEPVITATGLAMTYRAPVRPAGLAAAFRAVGHRRYRVIYAVAPTTFDLLPGEVVGFIGPNGAGKTTTMKMLCGILHPTAGSARVLGFVPWRRHHQFLRQIALVRGSQPVGGPTELTVLDSLRYQKLLYEITDDEFPAQLAELDEMLELHPLLNRQLRTLSLGERMRAGLALALLYRPRVLFLDEPTLGLDVSAAASVRRFVADYAARTGATVLLTSHYMADVDTLCDRVLLIDQGQLRYDGTLPALSERVSPYKLIRVAVADGDAPPQWERYGVVERNGPGQVALQVGHADVPRITAQLLADLPVADLTVENPPLESVLDRFYRGGAG